MIKLQLSLVTMIYILAPLIRVIWDEDVIEHKQKSINYFFHNFVTALLIAFQVFIAHWIGQVSIFDALFFSLALYWLLFDFALNYVRGKPVLSYYGDFEDEKNLSLIEKYVYAEVDWRLLLLTKLGLFLLAIAVYG
jgi:hypothetical protein